MEMVYITGKVSLRRKIIEMLEDSKIRDYQILDHAVVKNKIGPPRFDTEIWPGYNIAFLIQVSEEEKVGQLLDRLKRFNVDEAYNETELLTVCTWSLNNYFYGQDYQGH
ncbi:MAG: hypothetical protein CSA96_07130 [Bacteroidetes bacterium]|nr:MAG: hypothetical protein CSA96_07130 [Bacteroidota bacterium]